MTGSFLGIIYVARNYGKILINFDDAYSTVSSYCGPAPPLTGYSSNQYYSILHRILVVINNKCL